MKELIQELLDKGTIAYPALILDYYLALGLSNEEMLLVLQLVHHKGNLQLAAKSMGVSMDVATGWVNKLMERHQIGLETTTNSEGKIDVVYSTSPLLDQLAQLLVKEKSQKVEPVAPSSLKAKDLVSLFESEFGRSLSSMELDMVSQWVKVDRYSPDLIRLALREAVLNRAMSLKYVDRVLLNWEQNNIKTPQQVEEASQKYRRPLGNRSKEEPEVDDATSAILLKGW